MSTQLFEMIMRSTGGLSLGGIAVRAGLASLSVIALVLLIRLWGTRYGDNNTLAKSLFLSIMLHGCFGLGWATVAESYPRTSGQVEMAMNQEPLTFVGTIDSAPTEGKNKLPIFNSGPSTMERPLTRDTRTLNRIDATMPEDEIDTPQIDSSPKSNVIQELPSLVTQTEEQAPDLQQSPDNVPKSAVSSPMSVEQPLLEARPEVTSRSTPTRVTDSLPTNGIEAPPQPNARRGGSTRMTPFTEEGAVMTFPSEIAVDALPKPQGVLNNETIRRQGSPNPSPVLDPIAGSGPDGNNTVPGNSAPRRRDRAARSVTKPGNGIDDISVRPSIASTPSIASNRASISSPDDRALTGQSSADSPYDALQPDFERPKTPSASRGPARAPETYQARTSSKRMSSVLKHGGSEKSERAVENSLKWLAAVQERDGRWSSIRHGGGAVEKDPQGQDRLEGGKYADSGVTGLVILSFLGAGYTHEAGPYASEVRKALDWLIDQQKPENGYLGGNATKYDQNYCHAMATFALAEAYAMQKDANDYPELRNAVKRAVKLISALQNEDGGWRYSRVIESDMSMFGWQLMALKSAVNAGIPVPEETRRGMVRFLDARGKGKYGGLAGYKRDDEPTPAMTAEALFCRQMFSVRANDDASQEAVAYLRRHLPRATAYDEYYWYYGTLAMHNVDDESWQEWNNSLRDLLISMQRKEGHLAGSWDPRGKWAGIGGRLYSTALSTMCLEVYYRYQSNSKPPEER